MSKAFTKESDDQPERDLPPRQPSSAVLPPGAKNYLTASGARRLRAEMERLARVERPALAAATDDDNEGTSRRLLVLDQRLTELEQIFRSAEIVSAPAKSDQDRVAFGATVTVRTSGSSGDEEETYRIVGLDETDPANGQVSWLSPIAKALLHARLGDRVRFQFPSGEEELEIVRITYEQVAP